MQYQKAMNLWDEATHAQVMSGQLVLQPGQWIRLGDSKKLSRYAGMSRGGCIIAEHPSPIVTFSNFMIKRGITLVRTREARVKKLAIKREEVKELEEMLS